MLDILQAPTPPPTRPRAETWSRQLLHWSGIILVTTVWVSAALFGLYILAFYASALYQDDMTRWNQVLPRLYERNTGTATTGIGLHFAAGGIILILGSLQLIDSVRVRFPAVHRWVGRVYVAACVFAAVGGLAFILMKGTIGGSTMNVGFGLYGLLMLVAAIATYRYAVVGDMARHRAWALRLYALAIGSWLYRIEYGFWVMFTNGLGHTKTFDGWFDQFMAFFFYLPNLLVVDVFVRASRRHVAPIARIAGSLVLLAATTFLIVGTYYFTLYYWGPAIINWATGAPQGRLGQ